jgi:hypothetical protein
MCPHILPYMCPHILPYMCVPQLFLRREQQVDKQFKVDETATPPATGIFVLCSSICVRMLLYMFKADETATPPATGICVLCSSICVRMLLYKFKADETATPTATPATGICVLCSSLCVRMLLYNACNACNRHMCSMFLYVCPHATI